MSSEPPQTADTFDRAETEAGWRQAGWETLALYAAHNTRYLVNSEDDHTFRVAYPLAMQALNQARAGLELYRLGLTHQSVTNARVALEHAIIAQYVRAKGRPAAHEVRVNLQRRRKANLCDFKEFLTHAPGPTPFPAGLQAELDAPTFEGKNLPSTGDICKLFDPTLGLYSVYRQLTTGIHLSVDTVNLYVDLTEDGSVTAVHAAPSPAVSTSVDLSMGLGWSAVLGAHAVESLRAEGSRLAEVEAIAARHRLPPCLTLTG